MTAAAIHLAAVKSPLVMGPTSHVTENRSNRLRKSAMLYVTAGSGALSIAVGDCLGASVQSGA